MKRFNHKNKLCSQVNKIQEFDVINNEQEQLVTVNLPIHHIPTKHEEKATSTFNWSIYDIPIVIPIVIPTMSLNN